MENSLTQTSAMVVVRKTFIEVVDASARAENSPGFRRIVSDAALYERYASGPDDKYEDKDNQQVDCTQTSEKMGMPEAVPQRSSSKTTCSTVSSDGEVETIEDSELDSSSVLSCDTGSLCSDASTPICSLLSENARLSAENKRLREGICRAKKNTQLADVSTDSIMSTPFNATARNQIPYFPLQPAWDVTGASHATEAVVAGGEHTTVMWRNLPNNYTRAMLLALIDGAGFAGLYNFVYLPVDFKTRACLGYAFINLASPSAVSAFWSAFDGHSRWSIPCKKVSSVSWCPTQGLAANIKRYRDSPVMHNSVPDAYKPVIFVNCLRVQFPVPTRAPRAPDLTRGSKSSCGKTSK